MHPVAPPPPPAVIETFTLGANNQPGEAGSPACPASVPCGDTQGGFDFSMTKSEVVVTMSASAGWVFSSPATGGFCISFADRAGGAKTPVHHGHHQFPNDVSGCGTSTITFTYHNDNHCKSGHDGDCPSSIYGVVLVNGGASVTIDPVIQNGGNDTFGP